MGMRSKASNDGWIARWNRFINSNERAMAVAGCFALKGCSSTAAGVGAACSPLLAAPSWIAAACTYSIPKGSCQRVRAWQLQPQQVLHPFPAPDPM